MEGRLFLGMMLRSQRSVVRSEGGCLDYLFLDRGRF